jgi:PhnB protein
MPTPIPAGFNTVTPHLVVKGAADAIEFYAKAFGAKETERHDMHGAVVHATVRIGDSNVMVNDEFPDMGALGPQPGQPSPVTVHLYVEDVDAVFAQATAAGAEVVMPLADMFWGDRYAFLRDPFGHSGSIAPHV